VEKFSAKNFVVRPAVPEDLLPISALDSHPSVWHDSKIVDGIHAWRIWIDYANVLVATQGKHVVGVSLWFPTKTAKLSFLHKLFVSPDCRRAGVGRKLLTETCVLLDAAGETCQLTTGPDNAPMKKLCSDFLFLQKETLDKYYGPGKTRLLLCRHPTKTKKISVDKKKFHKTHKGNMSQKTENFLPIFNSAY